MGAIAIWAAKNKKVVIWGGVIIVIIVLLIVFKDKIKKLFTHDDEGDLNKKLKKEIHTENINKSPATMEALVSKLFESMNGSGTNFNNIKAVLSSLENADEWKSLVLLFGEKAETKGIWGFKNEDKRNLITWLTDEMDDAEMIEAKAILNKIEVKDLG